MIRTIIVGYGNIDRSDDGAAFAIINLVRERLAYNILKAGDTGLENLNGINDSVFLPQLLPEIMDMLRGYDRIIFVDAHTGEGLDDVNCSRITPQYVSSTFTHHMTPEALLAFLKTIYNHDPEAFLVSIKGYDFDFKRDFSPETEMLLLPACDKILQLLLI